MSTQSFELSEAIEILERTPAVTDALLRGLSTRWTQSNEGEETWTAFDIMGHLVHGEKTDWIPRMQIILGNGDKHFVPFDRFAHFEESKGKNLDQLIDEFTLLRRQNVAILKQTNPDAAHLEQTGIHPVFGEVTLRQLLAAWVTHDCTHLYQLSRVLAFQYREVVGPWKAFMRVLQ